MAYISSNLVNSVIYFHSSSYSYRVYPVSLDQLCKNFDVPGKLGKYNPKFSSIKVFRNSTLFEEFKSYSLQDAISLKLALDKAQSIYLLKYSVDICKAYSTSSLSIRILRLKFLTANIPVLNSITWRSKPSLEEDISPSDVVLLITIKHSLEIFITMMLILYILS